MCLIFCTFVFEDNGLPLLVGMIFSSFLYGGHLLSPMFVSPQSDQMKR